MKKFSILVSSCDSYEDLWNPFFTLLNRYWNTDGIKIYLSTESRKYEYEGLNIVSPLYGSSEKYEWSKRLQIILENIETEYVLFILDDFWLKSPVIEDNIDIALSYLDNNVNDGFFCLIPQREHVKNEYENCDYPEFYKRLGNSKFRITTQVGLWRKSFLMKLLRSHESAWMFETRATWRSKTYFSKYNVYSLKSTMPRTFDYHVCGVVSGGKYIEQFLDEFKEENLMLNLQRGTIKTMYDAKHSPLKRNINFYWNKFKSSLPW